MSSKSEEVFNKLILKKAQYVPMKDPTNLFGKNRLVATKPSKPKSPLQQMSKFFRKTPDVLSGGKFLKWL